MEYNEPIEKCFKICITGASGCGKTALIKRAVHGIFSSYYKKTVGIDFFNKKIHIDDHIYTLQFWDISGAESNTNMIKSYYNNMSGAFIVIDALCPELFSTIITRKKDIDRIKPVPTILLINKIDFCNDYFDARKYNDICKKLGFIKWIVVSAKDNTGLDEAIYSMCELVIDSSTLKYSPGDLVVNHSTPENEITILDKITNLFKNDNKKSIFVEIDVFINNFFGQLNAFFMKKKTIDKQKVNNNKMIYALIYRDISKILTRTIVDLESTIICLKAILLRSESDFYDAEINASSDTENNDKFKAEVSDEINSDFQPVIFDMITALSCVNTTPIEKINLMYDIIFRFKRKSNETIDVNVNDTNDTNDTNNTNVIFL